MTARGSDSPHILIVDDEPTNLMVMRSVLEPLAHVIYEARSGREALRHVLTTDFAVILLDISMPIMDGFETASLIQQRDRSRYVPIIFVTAGSNDELALNQAYTTGAVDYLSKPFNPLVLRSKVNVFVELYKQRDQLVQQAEALRASERERARRERAALKNELERAHLAELSIVLSRERRFLADVLASVTGGRLHLCDAPDELPRPLQAVGRPIYLNRTGSLMKLRHRASGAAARLGYAEDRTFDLLTAVSEAAMNAIVHGGGGKASVRADDHGGVQVWVSDKGEGISLDKLPKATLERGFSTTSTLGHGFWFMLNTVDRLSLLTAQSGTTVVVEQYRSKAPPWSILPDFPGMTP